MKKKPKLKPKGISTLELASELGCSVNQLYKLRDQGLFVQGKHWWIINPHAARPTYRWNLKRCLKAIGGSGDEV